MDTSTGDFIDYNNNPEKGLINGKNLMTGYSLIFKEKAFWKEINVGGSFGKIKKHNIKLWGLNSPVWTKLSRKILYRF